MASCVLKLACRGPFQRLLAYTALTEVVAASVPFLHWEGQFQGQSTYVEVVLGGQLRSQTCL